MTTDPAKVPNVRIPIWCTTTDVYNAPTKPYNGDPRKVEPGSLKVDGHAPDDQPTAPEWNYQGNAAGQWLDYLAQIGINNFSQVIATGVSSPAVDVNYAGGLWIVLSAGLGNQVFSSPNGVDWTNPGSLGSIAMSRLCPLDTIAVMIRTTSNIHYRTTGLANASFTDTSNPMHTMNAMVSNGRYTLMGIESAGTNIQFLTTTTETDIGTINLTQAASITIPSLTGSQSIVSTNMTSDRDMFHAVKDGKDGVTTDNRICALVSWRESTANVAQVYQYISSDDGASWVETANVFQPTDDSSANALAGVGYDEVRELWVAVTQDAAGGKIFTSPVESESWSHIGTVANEIKFDGITIVGGVWFLFDPDSHRKIYSSDGGLNWSDGARIPTIQTSIACHYSRELGQWAYLDSTESMSLSLKVGVTNTVAITPP